MCTQNDRSYATGLNSVSIQATIKPPKLQRTFGTGEGTTARIKDFFGYRLAGYTAASIGDHLGLPSRQLGKRLAELVKAGYLEKNGSEFSATGKLRIGFAD